MSAVRKLASRRTGHQDDPYSERAHRLVLAIHEEFRIVREPATEALLRTANRLAGPRRTDVTATVRRGDRLARVG